MTAKALELSRVNSGYGEAMVVHDLDLDLGSGEILAVLGKNGVGKSTLLKTVMGFLPTRGGGSIRLHGEEVTGQAPHQIARRGVAYAPQERALFTDISVVDNLRLGLRDERGFEEKLERACRHFPFLLERRGQPAGTLSGGEQKMLLMARALLPRPRLMLIDEISEGLQPSVIQRLADVLRGERDGSGTTILLVEQNVRFALSVADRYAVLKRGEIVDRGAVGSPEAERSIHEHLSV
jgi:ABC-type branched-subunit amino acid transport system ATPase component